MHEGSVELSNVAKLNDTNYFLITSDLVDSGIAANSQFAGCIARVPITVNPGFLQLFPVNGDQVQVITANGLSGRSISSITLTLSNERGESLPMSEDWSTLIQITFHTPP